MRRTVGNEEAPVASVCRRPAMRLPLTSWPRLRGGLARLGEREAGQDQHEAVRPHAEGAPVGAHAALGAPRHAADDLLAALGAEEVAAVLEVLQAHAHHAERLVLVERGRRAPSRNPGRHAAVERPVLTSTLGACGAGAAAARTAPQPRRRDAPAGDQHGDLGDGRGSGCRRASGRRSRG